MNLSSVQILAFNKKSQANLNLKIIFSNTLLT